MKTTLLRFAVFVLVVGLIALLSWLTLYEEDPCANPGGDVGAAVLADDVGDQDALRGVGSTGKLCRGRRHRVITLLVRPRS